MRPVSMKDILVSCGATFSVMFILTVAGMTFLDSKLDRIEARLEALEEQPKSVPGPSEIIIDGEVVIRQGESIVIAVPGSVEQVEEDR